MISINRGETFPIVVSLVDEESGILVAGQTVAYEIRDVYDNELTPPVSGALQESSFNPGVYKTTVSIDEPGSYICYSTCSGFIPNTEDIAVKAYHPTDFHNYNISVEEVKRTNETPTASQIARNVPIQKTDYLITKVKSDEALDWSSPVASGVVWAHYTSDTDSVPYMMGSE